jgi:hypothetical protein
MWSATLGTLDANEHVLAAQGKDAAHYFTPPSGADRNSVGDRGDRGGIGGSLPRTSSNGGNTPTLASDFGSPSNKYGMVSSVYRGATSPANSTANTRRISPAPAPSLGSSNAGSSGNNGGSSSTRYQLPASGTSPKRSTSVGNTASTTTTPGAGFPSFIANVSGAVPPPQGARTAFTMDSSPSSSPSSIPLANLGSRGSGAGVSSRAMPTPTIASMVTSGASTAPPGSVPIFNAGAANAADSPSLGDQRSLPTSIPHGGVTRFSETCDDPVTSHLSVTPHSTTAVSSAINTGVHAVTSTKNKTTTSNPSSVSPSTSDHGAAMAIAAANARAITGGNMATH